MSKDAPSKSKRIRLFVYCAACATISAWLIGYEVWATTNIRENLAGAQVLRLGTVRIRCDESHFWGSNVLYKRISDGSEYWGSACRDWWGAYWAINNGFGV